MRRSVPTAGLLALLWVILALMPQAADARVCVGPRDGQYFVGNFYRVDTVNVQCSVGRKFARRYARTCASRRNSACVLGPYVCRYRSTGLDQWRVRCAYRSHRMTFFGGA